MIWLCRRGCSQTGGQAAGDLLLCQQGVRPGEGHGEDEGRVGERQVDRHLRSTSVHSSQPSRPHNLSLLSPFTPFSLFSPFLLPLLSHHYHLSYFFIFLLPLSFLSFSSFLPILPSSFSSTHPSSLFVLLLTFSPVSLISPLSHLLNFCLHSQHLASTADPFRKLLIFF